jgi:hypothetical protein
LDPGNKTYNNLSLPRKFESKLSNDLLPPRKLINFDSIIINRNIISLISKHIDKMDSSNSKGLHLPYEFK